MLCAYILTRKLLISACPEFFTLPGMKKDQYVYHAMGSANAFGTFDTDTMTFVPE